MGQADSLVAARSPSTVRSLCGEADAMFSVARAASGNCKFTPIFALHWAIISHCVIILVRVKILAPNRHCVGT